MTRCSSISTVVAGEGRTILLPRGYKRDGTVAPVLSGHGHNSTVGLPPGTYGGVPAVGYGWATFSAYLDVGIPVVICDAGGGKGWNGNAALQHLENARLWARDNYATKDGPAHLFGFSMGGSLIASYAAENPTKTKSMVLACPGIAIDKLHDSNYGGYAAAELEAAHGGTLASYNAALPVKDPMVRAANGDYDALSILIYHAAPEDTTISLADVTQFANDSGAEIHKSSLLQHNPDVVDRNRLIDFIMEVGVS